MNERSVGLVAGGFAADPRLNQNTPPDQPKLDQLENQLLSLCDLAMKLRHRVETTATRVLGNRPPSPVPERGSNGVDAKDISARPALARLQSAINMLRSEIEGGHQEQDRVDLL